MHWYERLLERFADWWRERDLHKQRIQLTKRKRELELLILDLETSDKDETIAMRKAFEELGRVLTDKIYVEKALEELTKKLKK